MSLLRSASGSAAGSTASSRQPVGEGPKSGAVRGRSLRYRDEGRLVINGMESHNRTARGHPSTCRDPVTLRPLMGSRSIVPHSWGPVCNLKLHRARHEMARFEPDLKCHVSNPTRGSVRTEPGPFSAADVRNRLQTLGSKAPLTRCSGGSGVNGCAADGHRVAVGGALWSTFQRRHDARQAPPPALLSARESRDA